MALNLILFLSYPPPELRKSLHNRREQPVLCKVHVALQRLPRHRFCQWQPFLAHPGQSWQVLGVTCPVPQRLPCPQASCPQATAPAGLPLYCPQPMTHLAAKGTATHGAERLTTGCRRVFDMQTGPRTVATARQGAPTSAATQQAPPPPTATLHPTCPTCRAQAGNCTTLLPWVRSLPSARPACYCYRNRLLLACYYHKLPSQRQPLTQPASQNPLLVHEAPCSLVHTERRRRAGADFWTGL